MNIHAGVSTSPKSPWSNVALHFSHSESEYLLPAPPLFHPPDGHRRSPLQPTAEGMTVMQEQELKRAPLDFEGNKCRLSAASPRVPAQNEPRSKRLLCLHTLSLHFEDVVLYRSSNAKELCWPQ